MRRTQSGFTLLEMLVATVLGILVVASAVTLFIGGMRLAIGMQATSHALRAGSSGIDRLRLELMPATSYTLPDDDKPWDSWDNGPLGNAHQYLVTSNNQTLNTAIFLSLPSNHSVQIRTDATTTTSTSMGMRRTTERGILLYRGNNDGSVNANSGTFLWMRSYANGTLTAKSVLYRKLSSSADAVSFRRGNASGTLLRYRLVLAQKDAYNQERTVLGKNNSNLLETSDYSLTLLNSIGGNVPSSALPTTAFQNQ